MTNPKKTRLGTWRSWWLKVETPNIPLRAGDNPLADQLIADNDRLRRERNDWMSEAERLKRLVDGYERRS